MVCINEWCCEWFYKLDERVILILELLLDTNESCIRILLNIFDEIFLKLVLKTYLVNSFKHRLHPLHIFNVLNSLNKFISPILILRYGRLLLLSAKLKTTSLCFMELHCLQSLWFSVWWRNFLIDKSDRPIPFWFEHWTRVWRFTELVERDHRWF